MCPLYNNIPHKLDAPANRDTISLSVWYKGQAIAGAPPGARCRRCGSSQHYIQNCPEEHRVCFICQGNHLAKECPRNDGTRESSEAVVFLSGKSCFSNFSTDYPIEIDGKNYTCGEQYIQSKKSELFGDEGKKEQIMRETDPKEMKKLGDKVRNYEHSVWMRECSEIALTCTRQKFATYEKARKILLHTGNKIIGEATKSKVWGIGLHISDSRALNREEWSGSNLMGGILMQIRSEMRAMEATEEIDSVLGIASTTEGTTASTEQIDKMSKDGG